MDDSEEAALLIATSMVVLVTFAVAVLAVMLIYRKRKLLHQHELDLMNERFASELLRTQLEVRQRTMEYVGRELHDNVGQQLTLAFLYLQQHPQNPQQLAAVSGLINDSLTELRDLSRGLVDAGLHESQELSDLIVLERDKVRSAGVCGMTFEQSGDPFGIHVPARIVILRILQEFVQNSIKHSRCTQISVTLEYLTKEIRLCASDNGKGFELLHDHPGIGIKNMKRRAELFGGSLLIESTPGKGTTIVLTIPSTKLTI